MTDKEKAKAEELVKTLQMIQDFSHYTRSGNFESTQNWEKVIKMLKKYAVLLASEDMR